MCAIITVSALEPQASHTAVLALAGPMELEPLLQPDALPTGPFAAVAGDTSRTLRFPFPVMLRWRLQWAVRSAHFSSQRPNALKGIGA